MANMYGTLQEESRRSDISYSSGGVAGNNLDISSAMTTDHDNIYNSGDLLMHIPRLIGQDRMMLPTGFRVMRLEKAPKLGAVLG